MPYNVRSVSHTGSRSATWIGRCFEFVASDEVGGAFLADITGVPGAHVRAALVTKGRSTVELLQYTAPDDRKTVRLRPSDVEAVAEACAGHGWAMPGQIRVPVQRRRHGARTRPASRRLS